MYSYRKNIVSGFLFTIILALLGCIEPYNAKVSIENSNVLVIDGFLNSSANSAKVKLSRSVALNGSSSFPAEENAIVNVENEDGNSYKINETGNGQYESTLNFVNEKKYRLRIKTSDGKEYLSEFITLKPAPALDSISWKPKSDGITIYANTHDPSGKARYYQWAYTEVWEYNSEYNSANILLDGQVYTRPASEGIYICWSNEKSSSILIGSSASLGEDVITNFPLTFVPRGSTKLLRLYSILVQQRALTEDAYNFWQQLKKTTENLGGLFDPLPSQVTGNIHSINNSSEPVLGYFSGGGVQEKRIFIKFYDLPDYLLAIPKPQCVEQQIPLADIPLYPNSTLLIAGYGVTLLGYTTSAPSCIDCRISGGGTLTKPDFWPR